MDPQPQEFTGRLWGHNISALLKVLCRREILKQKRLKKLNFKAFASHTMWFLKNGFLNLDYWDIISPSLRRSQLASIRVESDIYLLEDSLVTLCATKVFALIIFRISVLKLDSISLRATGDFQCGQRELVFLIFGCRTDLKNFCWEF